MDRRLSPWLLGALLVVALSLVGLWVYSMTTVGLHGARISREANGATVGWTGYSPIGATTHRAHPMIALALWTGAAAVAALMLRAWGLRRFVRPRTNRHE